MTSLLTRCGVLFFLVLLLLPAFAQGSVGKPVAVPDDGVIKLTDYGFREWGPELVHYTLDTRRFAPGKLVLLDDAGKAVPFNIEKGADGGAVLAFVAAVSSGATATYRLQASPTDRAGENSALIQRAAPGPARGCS